MRNLCCLLAAVMLCSACIDAEADDCRNTATCPLPPDAGAPAPDAGSSTCEGPCVRGNNFDWQNPWMVYLSPDQSGPPPCPKQAPNISDYRAAPAASSCAACACDPPTGTCALPTMAHASNGACPANDSATIQTPFDAPTEWEGSCTSQQAIAADMDCNGGPCVQSITFASLAITEAGCMPSPPIVPQGNPQSFTFARTCGGTAKGECSDNGDVCVPALPAVDVDDDDPGFWTYCVSKHGAYDDYTMACPPEYPNMYHFSLDYDDSRGCAPCKCGAPEGSTCSSLISVYADNQCSMTEQLGSITVSSAAPMCLNLPPGAPLGSKAASPPLYKPGTCEPSGGDPTGTVTPFGPMTFCCQK